MAGDAQRCRVIMSQEIGLIPLPMRHEVRGQTKCPAPTGTPIRAFSQSKADRHDGCHADQPWSFMNVLFEYVSSTSIDDLSLSDTKAQS